MSIDSAIDVIDRLLHSFIFIQIYLYLAPRTSGMKSWAVPTFYLNEEYNSGLFFVTYHIMCLS